MLKPEDGYTPEQIASDPNESAYDRHYLNEVLAMFGHLHTMQEVNQLAQKIIWARRVLVLVIVLIAFRAGYVVLHHDVTVFSALYASAVITAGIMVRNRSKKLRNLNLYQTNFLKGVAD